MDRYQKQIILDNYGLDFQNKIKNIKVLIIGLGGIGCPVLIYLSNMGFENIGIIDNDIVELSNLHRQIIYNENDIGKLKTDCSEKYCKERNNNVNIEKYSLKLDNKNSTDIFKQYEIIIDCTDNIYTRYVINDTCIILNKFYFFGSSIGTSGQIAIFNYPKYPCLRCIYPSNNYESCESSGVLGILPGIIGNLLVLEVIKYIQNNNVLIGKLLNFDIAHGITNMNITNKNPKCIACSDNPSINEINISILDIYTEKCRIKNEYGINKSDNQNIVFLNNIDSIDFLYKKYINNKNNLYFDCENKIKSKSLVNKLRLNKNNCWYII